MKKFNKVISLFFLSTMIFSLFGCEKGNTIVCNDTDTDTILHKIDASSLNISSEGQMYVNAEGQIDKEKLKEFLESLQRSMQKNENQLNATYGSKSSEKGAVPPYFAGDSSFLATTQVSLVFSEVNGPLDMMFPFALRKENICDFQNHQGLFVPKSIIGVTRSSKNQDLAKEFILTLLSEELQTADLSDGFPINTKALENWGNKPSNGSSIAVLLKSLDGSGQKILSAEWPNSEERVELSAMLNSLKTPIIQDRVLFDILLTETTAFLDGSTTKETAAASIISKVTIYQIE